MWSGTGTRLPFRLGSAENVLSGVLPGEFSTPVAASDRTSCAISHGILDTPARKSPAKPMPISPTRTFKTAAFGLTQDNSLSPLAYSESGSEGPILWIHPTVVSRMQTDEDRPLSSRSTGEDYARDLQRWRSLSINDRASQRITQSCGPLALNLSEHCTDDLKSPSSDRRGDSSPPRGQSRKVSQSVPPSVFRTPVRKLSVIHHPRLARSQSCSPSTAPRSKSRTGRVSERTTQPFGPITLDLPSHRRNESRSPSFACRENPSPKGQYRATSHSVSPSAIRTTVRKLSVVRQPSLTQSRSSSHSTAPRSNFERSTSASRHRFGESPKPSTSRQNNHFERSAPRDREGSTSNTLSPLMKKKSKYIGESATVRLKVQSRPPLYNNDARVDNSSAFFKQELKGSDIDKEAKKLKKPCGQNTLVFRHGFPMCTSLDRISEASNDEPLALLSAIHKEPSEWSPALSTPEILKRVSEASHQLIANAPESVRRARRRTWDSSDDFTDTEAKQTHNFASFNANTKVPDVLEDQQHDEQVKVEQTEEPAHSGHKATSVQVVQQFASNHHSKDKESAYEHAGDKSRWSTDETTEDTTDDAASSTDTADSDEAQINAAGRETTLCSVSKFDSGRHVSWQVPEYLSPVLTKSVNGTTFETSNYAAIDSDYSSSGEKKISPRRRTVRRVRPRGDTSLPKLSPLKLRLRSPPVCGRARSPEETARNRRLRGRKLGTFPSGYDARSLRKMHLDPLEFSRSSDAWGKNLGEDLDVERSAADSPRQSFAHLYAANLDQGTVCLNESSISVGKPTRVDSVDCEGCKPDKTLSTPGKEKVGIWHDFSKTRHTACRYMEGDDGNSSASASLDSSPDMKSAFGSKFPDLGDIATQESLLEAAYGDSTSNDENSIAKNGKTLGIDTNCQAELFGMSATTDLSQISLVNRIVLGSDMGGTSNLARGTCLGGSAAQGFHSQRLGIAGQIEGLEKGLDRIKDSIMGAGVDGNDSDNMDGMVVLLEMVVKVLREMAGLPSEVRAGSQPAKEDNWMGSIRSALFGPTKLQTLEIANEKLQADCARLTRENKKLEDVFAMMLSDEKHELADLRERMGRLEGIWKEKHIAPESPRRSRPISLNSACLGAENRQSGAAKHSQPEVTAREEEAEAEATGEDSPRGVWRMLCTTDTISRDEETKFPGRTPINTAKVCHDKIEERVKQSSFFDVFRSLRRSSARCRDQRSLNASSTDTCDELSLLSHKEAQNREDPSFLDIFWPQGQP